MGENIKLSILITTHNNEKNISRCLESVLAQRINVPYEIIISDDTSSDGTCTILKQYRSKHPDIIKLYTINSDDVNPVIGLERAGWNKAHVYMCACGEYIVNLDGDDYLRSNDIYNLQLQQLETHPECIASMQDLWIVNDGDNISSGWKWGQTDLKTGDVFDFSEYILKNRIVSHPAFMMRRDKNTDIVKKYGKFFDDEFNVMHHITQGSIIYINRADYIYVQYNNSLNHSYIGLSRYARFLCLPLIYSQFWPNYSSVFLKGKLYEIQHNIKNILNTTGEITENVAMYLSQFHGWIFSIFKNKRVNNIEKFRLWFIRKYVLLLNLSKPTKDWPYKILLRIFIG